MFCNSSVSVNHVLRSFRSHKHLKDQERIEVRHGLEQQPYQLAHVVPIRHVRPVKTILHPRRPSETSSIGTMTSDISSSRPSTSDTAMTDRSIEINPLRLNPPTEELCMPQTSLRSPPKHHYQSDYGFNRPSFEGTGFGLRSDTYREPLRTGSMEVYDGFDFGFDSGKTPGAGTPGRRTPGGRTPGRRSHPGAGDDYFGTQPKSHWSDSESDEEDEDEDEEMDETPGGPGPATSITEYDISPVRPRPQPQDSAKSPLNFIKRGDWKRRGIVFNAPAPAAKEDVCFDLEG